jgi:hypothetical protein
LPRKQDLLTKFCFKNFAVYAPAVNSFKKDKCVSFLPQVGPTDKYMKCFWYLMIGTIPKHRLTKYLVP